MLKRLAGIKWGSSSKTLNTTYNMYIKPVLKYCGEVLITTHKCNKKILEQTQNQALRLITGAVKSTPTEALRITTNNKPLVLEMETQALLQYEKLLRLSRNKFDNYKESSSKFKTQVGFIQEVKKLKNNL